MTSEEKVHKFLNEPIEGFRTAMINLLNEHAAEARADLEQILTRAVEWWLLEGYKSFDGAPAWVFSARQLEELKDQVKKSPHDEG